MKKTSAIFFVLAFIITGFLYSNSQASAHASIKLNSIIEPGLLAASLRNASGEVLSTPKLKLDKLFFKNNMTVSSGYLGANGERLYIENPGATAGGWSVNLASAIIKNNYVINYNETQKSAFSYNININPTTAKVFTDCLKCSLNNIALGSKESDVKNGTPVTLVQSGNQSEDIGRWYITGVAIESVYNSKELANDELVLTSATI